MIEYKSRGNDIIKDGHTMFRMDVITDLNRLAYLEDMRSKRMSMKTITMSMEMFEKIVEHIECIVQIPITCDRNCDDDCKACFVDAINKDNKEKGITDKKVAVVEEECTSCGLQSVCYSEVNTMGGHEDIFSCSNWEPEETT